MGTSMTIEGFHTRLASSDDSPLLVALRQLTATGKPEDITRLAEDAAQSWMNWRPPLP